MWYRPVGFSRLFRRLGHWPHVLEMERVVKNADCQLLYLREKESLCIKTSQGSSIIHTAEERFITSSLELLNFHLLWFTSVSNVSNPLGFFKYPLGLCHIQTKGWSGKLLKPGSCCYVSAMVWYGVELKELDHDVQVGQVAGVIRNVWPFRRAWIHFYKSRRT